MMVNDLPVAGGDMAVTLAYNPAGQIRHFERDNDAYAWTGGAAVSKPYTVNGQNQYLSAGSVNFNYGQRKPDLGFGEQLHLRRREPPGRRLG